MKHVKKFEELSSRINSVARGKNKDEDLENAQTEILNIFNDLSKKYGTSYIMKDFREIIENIIDRVSLPDDEDAYIDPMDYKRNKRLGAIK